MERSDDRNVNVVVTFSSLYIPWPPYTPQLECTYTVRYSPVHALVLPSRDMVRAAFSSPGLSFMQSYLVTCTHFLHPAAV